MVPSVSAIAVTHKLKPARVRLRGSIAELKTLRMPSKSPKQPKMVDQATSTPMPEAEQELHIIDKYVAPEENGNVIKRNTSKRNIHNTE